MRTTVFSRALTTLVAATALALAATPGAPAAPALSATVEQADDPYREPFRFLSAPDLFNADIGDVSTSGYYTVGAPNSWSPRWAETTQNLFGQLADFEADTYLVAGDMVNGRWHYDRGDTGTFGPGRTIPERIARVRRAGETYYPQWLEFWTDAGVPAWRVRTAVGDHEMGDNPWKAGATQLAAYDTYKDLFAEHFTRRPDGTPRYPMRPVGTPQEDSAYAKYLDGGRVLLVTVDWFDKVDGAIDVTVDGGQLAWFDRVLAEAPEETTIIVQGHFPILEPVRRRGGGGPTTAYGESSPIWQSMVRHGADLYLAGEVHDFTAVKRGPGPVQITHGGYAGNGRTDFIVGDVLADGSIQVDARTIDVVARSRARIWQTGGEIRERVSLAPTSRSVGSLVVSSDGTVLQRTGCLDVYTGPYAQKQDCTR
ncbi:metallophosphoesterase [Nocardioides sp. CFH 31398]|uniref:metallophosphoesterase family protein n=1 Tax=Nocardioides sp. CFH 31398 TaxID=2919579 RepID=UPI001F05BE12|nr:metallophosphoesterase [Nocardioides sp. CFH 31398]MCH1866617.1 hypothetical protein [Nocardioides sp. CFH 31398]